VEAMNGADKFSGLLVHSRKRFLARKKETMLASNSVVLPLVLKKLTKIWTNRPNRAANDLCRQRARRSAPKNE
jgi:hypothetical protein